MVVFFMSYACRNEIKHAIMKKVLTSKEFDMQKQSKQLVIIASIIAMILMGTVYSYSVFRPYVESEYQIGTLLSGIPYMISLLCYAFSVMITGRYLTPNRIRRIAVTGTILIVIGWFLSSITTSFVMFSISYGVLMGIGVGMVYGLPIFMTQKLFPKRSGFMTGIILLGFGMSPLLTAPLAKILIDLTTMRQTFLILGMTFFIIQMPLMYFFKLHAHNQVETSQFIEVRTVLKPFKRIYLLFVIAATIGLMMIGLSYQIGVTVYQFNAVDVTWSLSIFAFMNGIARPIFGRLMDKKGFNYAVITSLLLMFIASIIGLINQGQYLVLYLISFGLFWFNLGAWLAIVPATIKEFYGIKHYAKTYGVMFTAYGLGAILGTFVSGIIMDLLSWTTYLYIVIIIFLVLSTFVLSKTKIIKEI